MEALCWFGQNCGPNRRACLSAGCLTEQKNLLLGYKNGYTAEMLLAIAHGRQYDGKSLDWKVQTDMALGSDGNERAIMSRLCRKGNEDMLAPDQSSRR